MRQLITRAIFVAVKCFFVFPDVVLDRNCSDKDAEDVQSNISVIKIVLLPFGCQSGNNFFGWAFFAFFAFSYSTRTRQFYFLDNLLQEKGINFGDWKIFFDKKIPHLDNFFSTKKYDKIIF